MARQEAGGRGWLQVYLDIPPITRTYTTACVLLTLATNLELISQYHIYLNPDLILSRFQYYRIITTFLYSGPSTFGTAFNLLFTYRYSRILEDTFYYQRSSDFCFMYLFLAFVIFILSVSFTNLLFLGQTLTHAILYLWCRRNPSSRVLIFGILVLQADCVPFVLVGLSFLTGNPLAVDIVAIAAGHIYYFLEDVFPVQRGGFKILETPGILKFLFNEVERQPSSDDNNERIEVFDENNNLVGIQ